MDVNEILNWIDEVNNAQELLDMWNEHERN